MHLALFIAGAIFFFASVGLLSSDYSLIGNIVGVVFLVLAVGILAWILGMAAWGTQADSRRSTLKSDKKLQADDADDATFTAIAIKETQMDDHIGPADFSYEPELAEAERREEEARLREERRLAEERRLKEEQRLDRERRENEEREYARTHHIPLGADSDDLFDPGRGPSGS